MQYVKKVRGRDGLERLYFRKRGAPSTPLKAAWDTPELKAEVAAILADLEPARPIPGSLRAALREYEIESADFIDLAASTKREYRYIMRELDEDFGQLAIGYFTPANIMRLRNQWAPRGHRAANVRLQILKNALWPCIVQANQGDPFAMIEQVRRPHDAAEPHKRWADATVRAVFEAALLEQRTGIARAVAIGRYVGPRRGDIVRLTRAARQHGRFSFVSGKRKVLVDVREDPELTALLARAPTPKDCLLLAPNMDGRAYSEDGIALELRKLVARLHAAGKIDSAEYSLHGLRHTRGVELALAGCTDAEGAAQLGHHSPHSFATYRRQAERIQMADGASDKIARLRERQGNGRVGNDVANMWEIGHSQPVSKGQKPQ